MAGAIGPGTPLIAVCGDNPYPRNPAYRLTIGGIYFVERVYHGEAWQQNRGVCTRDNCGTAHVVVHGKPWGYCPNKFRPLIDGDPAITVEEADEPVHEDA